MSDESIPLDPTRYDTTTGSLPHQPVDLADVKAQRYVGKFFHRRRVGRKIIAELEGNHGTYVVSLSPGGAGVVGSCNCYIGARGDCHHVRALAQTYQQDPGSFAVQETRNRRQLFTLEDLGIYLETTSLEHLLAALQARGISRQRVTQLLGTTRRALGEALRAEKSHEPSETLGALKLACYHLVEWSEAAARGDDLAQALSGHSRRELVELIAEFVQQLSPRRRGQLLAYWSSSRSNLLSSQEPEGEMLLEDIADFFADCEKGLYFDWAEVAAYQESFADHHQPEIEAFGLLDSFFSRADRCHEAGAHDLAVAAYERLFEAVSSNSADWFGFGEISSWLETDLRSVSSRYLASLGQLCSPEEYVQRARSWVGWSYPDLLITESTLQQLQALEASLEREMEATEDRGGPVPYALTLLRQLYDHQGRSQESLELCRRWRHQYPALRGPLMDHAEEVGDWGDLESLAREALSLADGRSRRLWGPDPARARLERRLSRALERQGEPVGALAHAQRAFRSQPDLEGYRSVCDLAARISEERRREAVEEITGFLRAQLSVEEMVSDGRVPSGAATLLASVLLAEGQSVEAFDLAMKAMGATQVQLLNLVASHYLERAEGPGDAEEALSRAGECYRRLVELFIEARGRNNYTIAATYAAMLRETYLRRGRPGDFDGWYRQLMDAHHRFRALREEMRRRLGSETAGDESAA